MLVALTSDQELGLGLAGAIFISFSLVSALVIPRYRPDFPGRKGLGLFIVLTLLMMVGMLGAVVVFGAESESEAAGEHETSAASGPAETAGGATSPTTVQGPPAGNAQAGKALFAANGCGGCHTYSAAGSNGTVGPNLDEGLQGKDEAFIAKSIQDPNADVTPGYQPGIMPSFSQLSDKQVSDLVSFLTQS